MPSSRHLGGDSGGSEQSRKEGAGLPSNSAGEEGYWAGLPRLKRGFHVGGSNPTVSIAAPSNPSAFLSNQRLVGGF